MATCFLNREQLWRRIPTLARTTPKAVVVVAFCGVDAPRLLPLRSGSTLIVDASAATVKAGATSPSALARFLKKRVRVYSVDHLHAKIFLFGRRVLIGSSNISTNSARLLEEAALETTDAAAVRDAKAYVRALDKNPLGPEEIRALGQIYQKPRFHFTGAKPQRKKAGVWLVPLRIEDWDEEDYQQANLERPKARKRMTSRAFELHEFHWETGRFVKDVARHQRAVQILRVKKGRTEIYRDGAIVAVRRYKKSGKRNALVFLEIKRSRSCTTLKKLRRRVPEFARKLARVKAPRIDFSAQTRRAVRTLWPE